MFSKLLEALTGTRKRVIAVIPSVELTAIREIVKEEFLNRTNAKAATAQHTFDYVNTVSSERLALEAEKVIDEAKQSFLKTERCQLLKVEFNKLRDTKRFLVKDLLAAHGIDYTDKIELDATTGEVSIEEEVTHD